MFTGCAVAKAKHGLNESSAESLFMSSTTLRLQGRALSWWGDEESEKVQLDFQRMRLVTRGDLLGIKRIELPLAMS